MKTQIMLIIGLGLFAHLPFCTAENDLTKMPDEYWKQNLTPDQFEVCREGETEAPGSGAYYLSKEKGVYLCSSCGAELFSSDAKFDSGTGWPSFSDPINAQAVELLPDLSKGMIRTEVRCKRCGAHLGHVFDDGPTASGKRFCINSLCLKQKLSEKR